MSLSGKVAIAGVYEHPTRWAPDKTDSQIMAECTRGALADRIKELRAEGKLEVLEFPPPPNIGTNNYNFENLASPHVVNCPTPMTVDRAIHEARQLDGP